MRFDRLKRRDFITLLGGAATWPLAARAQQPALPVIGWLGAGSPNGFEGAVAAFRKGVNEAGFIEGKTVAIEYRWADGQFDRLPVLAAELVRRPVAAIMASGGSYPTRAAKAATSTIPIVFTAPTDPAALGLVDSLNRPGGNVTGVNFFLAETRTKLLGLLHELVPAAQKIALLIGTGSAVADSVVKDLQTAAPSLGLQLRVLRPGTDREISDVLAGLAQQRPDALLVQSGPFIASYLGKIATQAVQLSLPAMSNGRDFAAAGGLISYGTSITDAYHQAGLYVGRILRGEKPADLPVVQSTKFELVVNLKTAKAIGVEVPPTLLAQADEVIE
jgi:putative tryptophan/tyrosine transport system substrate-binding protein